MDTESSSTSSVPEITHSSNNPTLSTSSSSSQNQNQNQKTLSASNSTLTTPTTEIQQSNQNLPSPSDFEEFNVVQVYDQIAAHFSSTRKYRPWQYVKTFLKNLGPSFIGDFGCGNGKYIPCINPDSLWIGSDTCAGLLQDCIVQGGGCLLANILSLPFTDNCFDYGISVAVLHHLSTPLRRIQATIEMLRTIKPGGVLLFSVWAFVDNLSKNKKKRPKNQDIFMPWHLQYRYSDPVPLSKAVTSLLPDDIQVPIPVMPTQDLVDDGSSTLESAPQDDSLIPDSHPQSTLITNGIENGTPIPSNGNVETDPQTDPESYQGTLIHKEGNTLRVYHRYYHLFTLKELQEMSQFITNGKLLKITLERSNYYVEYQRI